MLQPAQGCGGVKHQAGLAAFVTDQLQGSIHVLAGLGMKGDVAGPGPRKVGNNPIYRFYHQVHIDIGRNTMLAQGLTDQGSDSEVWNVVIVHHIEMNQFRARGKHSLHFLAQAGEIGGKYRWSNNRSLFHNRVTPCKAVAETQGERLTGISTQVMANIDPGTSVR